MYSLVLLNIQPKKDSVRINTRANGARYLPIDYIESKLDELFAGLWQTRKVELKVVVNEIVCTLELGVYHPVLKDWIWRVGVGAAMIQQQKNSQITDIGAKHKNTLGKDAPHAKAEALKNAAKSIGFQSSL